MQPARGLLLQHGIAQGFIDRQGLHHGGPTAEAGVVAGRTPSASPELACLPDFFRHAGQYGRFWLIGLGADGAVAPDEPHAQHPRDGRRQQEGFDAHVDEAGEDSGGAARVDGADDQMPGEPSLNGDLGCLRIADLADHDHLRILSHERSQSHRVGVFASHVALGLRDEGQRELHRVFHRGDANARA